MASQILPLPTRARILELLIYTPKTGIFQWRGNRGCMRAGDIAGVTNAKGYRYIRLDGQLFRANRLAWMITHNQDPADMEIDHKDGDRDNNAAANLREATCKQNQENRGLNKNNKSGHRGVRMDHSRGCWVAEITHNRKNIQVKGFPTIEQAVDAARQLRANLFTHDQGRAP